MAVVTRGDFAIVMDNGNCSLSVGEPKYKRRKVFVVRDYPAGCGWSVPALNRGVEITVGGNEDEDSLGLESKGALRIESEFRPTEGLKGSLPLEGQVSNEEHPVVSAHQVEEHSVKDKETAKSQMLENLDALNDTELLKHAEVVEHDTFDLSKSLDQAGIVSPENGTGLPNCYKSCSTPDVLTPRSCSSLKKAVTMKNPPRCKVSVVRDYPPFCGRDAPCLSKDEVEILISSIKKGNLDLQRIAAEAKPLKEIATTATKQKVTDVQVEVALKDRLEINVSKLTTEDKVIQFGSESNANREVKKQDEFGSASEKLAHKEIIELNHHQFGKDPESVTTTGDLETLDVEGKTGKEIVVDTGNRSPIRNLPDVSGYQHKASRRLAIASNKAVVLGLMSQSKCPWRKAKGALAGGTNEGKRKKSDMHSLIGRPNTAVETKDTLNHSREKYLKKIKPKKETDYSQGMGQLVIWDEKNSLEHDNRIQDLDVIQRIRPLDVSLPPFGQGNQAHGTDSSVTRAKVRETLRLFQAVCRKLLQEEEAKMKEEVKLRARVDLQAAKILKDKKKYINIGKQIIGPVPGVEVGDEFQYRVELNVVGLHRQIQSGIDYVRYKDKILATSVVASGGYPDDFDSSDVMTYTGQGGNMTGGDKAPEDQKLERGNLALKNSSEEKNPVRVIRGSESVDGSRIYIYDGLYIVETYWQDVGMHGKLVFKFRLRRMPGQPELAWREMKKLKKFRVREGICVEDISGRKEPIPICAVNTIDSEKPLPFIYTTKMIYPDWCILIPPEGCNCTKRCSDSAECSCAVKNGGEIPFNHNGAIVEAKPLVYECGPSCRCPPTCYNRVSQCGIRFRLEVFKTENRGWGVRSQSSIPSGSFICEYVGELLEEKEAEQRTGNDEYLFDIGNNYNDSSLWDGLSALIPDAQFSYEEGLDDGGFTIDAAQYGNVGRFINHSCSPNLYAQNVLFDHDDKRIPHIMLFAAENIPPLQELTYHYNYMIDQVYDSNGNIKTKKCYCGSADCSGRMY